VALLHRVRHALGALAQRIQRATLRIHGTIGITVAELAGGVAHRVVGSAEVVAVILVGLIALIPLALLALVALLTLFALLALLLLPLASLLTALALL
jgi:hypothetical protein